VIDGVFCIAALSTRTAGQGRRRRVELPSSSNSPAGRCIMATAIAPR